MELTLPLNRVKAWLRARARQNLAIITFDGSMTKPETIATTPQGGLITDHHGRRGRWDMAHTSGLHGRIMAALRR